MTPLRTRNRVVDGQKLCLRCNRLLSLAEYSKNGKYVQARCKRCATEVHWIRTYGLTEEEVEVIRQQLTCDACGMQFRTNREKHIDHCHQEGHVRGVLCQGCNVALGCVNDSIERLQALISYINGKGRSVAWDDNWSDPLVGVRTY